MTNQQKLKHTLECKGKHVHAADWFSDAKASIPTLAS
jgi:hypothetical protein